MSLPMTFSIEDIAACGVDIKPPSIKGPSSVAKLLENRQRLANVAKETNAAMMRNQPHVRQRKTANGVVNVNTNNWFLVDDVYYFSFSIGPKKLNLNGREVFRGGTLAESCAKLAAIETAALAGQLDAQITAMFSLSDDQKARMRDGKFISRMAKAELTGKATKMADRARLAQLLMDPVHNESYSAAVAA